MDTSKRAKIIAAALKLFIENGFHNTSTASISKAAGVATGTLFLYFPNKEALINTLYKEAKGQLGQALKASFPQDGNTREKLRHLWIKGNEWALANNEAFRFIHMYKSSPFISTLTKEEVVPSIDFAVSFIRDGVKKGDIAPIDMELLFSIIDSLLATSANFIFIKGARNKKQIIEQTFTVLWNGIAAR